MRCDNFSVILAERPKADIIPGQTLKDKVSPAPTPSQLKDGEVLVENLYLSLDPAMRGWMRAGRSYTDPVNIGDVMRGATCGRVLASKSLKAKVGDYVSTLSGWTEYAIVNDRWIWTASEYPGLRDPKDMISVLGWTGLTAWVGMTQIADPKPDELVVVSGAAGATGSVAAQIAKMNGARVIGITGSDDKCRWLVEELGLDRALNYKDPNFAAKFCEATSGLIDVYFDNVGGEILSLALYMAKPFARFVACGMISQSNVAEPDGPKNFLRIIQMRIKMQGFVVTDYESKFLQARRELSQWVADGKIKTSEHILTGGLKVAQQGLVSLFKGINTGKLLVEIKSPSKPSHEL